MRGIVRWFDDEKGYGFIENQYEESIFVHYSSIISNGYKTLFKGQFVSFKLLDKDKGLKAVNVVVDD